MRFCYNWFWSSLVVTDQFVSSASQCNTCNSCGTAKFSVIVTELKILYDLIEISKYCFTPVFFMVLYRFHSRCQATVHSQTGADNRIFRHLLHFQWLLDVKWIETSPQTMGRIWISMNMLYFQIPCRINSSPCNIFQQLFFSPHPADTGGFRIAILNLSEYEVLPLSEIVKSIPDFAFTVISAIV